MLKANRLALRSVHGSRDESGAARRPARRAARGCPVRRRRGRSGAADDPDLVRLPARLAMAGRYLPPDLAAAYVQATHATQSGNVAITMRPERWHSADFSDLAD